MNIKFECVLWKTFKASKIRETIVCYYCICFNWKYGLLCYCYYAIAAAVSATSVGEIEFYFCVIC